MNGWKPANLDKIQQLAFGATAHNQDNQASIKTGNDEYDARNPDCHVLFHVYFQCKVI